MARSHRAELSQLRSLMTGQGRSVDEIATAVRSQYGYSLRAAYRHAVGWTLDQAAERYNQAADDADARLSGPRLSEWENWPQTGTRRPTAFNLLILSKVYSTQPTQLVTHDEEKHLDHRDRALLRHLHQSQPTAEHTQTKPVPAAVPPDEEEALPADTGLAVPWTASGSLRALRVVTDPEPMTKPPIGRRQFVILAGAAATAPAHEWLLANPPGDVARPGTVALPPGVVDHLETITAELQRMDDQLGGASLLEVIRGHLRHVVGLIENRTYPETLGRRLHATAAELLNLAGWSCFEANGHAEAQRHWVAALHAANTAGDRALGADVLGYMSAHAVELGHTRDAVTLAGSARAGYPGTSPKVAAILALRVAKAHALNGSVTDCRRSLDTAFDRLRDTPSSAGEPAWSYWMHESQAHLQAGGCYAQLNDWARARSHLESAARLEDGRFPREDVACRIRLATTYLRQDQPDLDQALALGIQAAGALSGTINSVRNVKRLKPLVDDLATYRQRPAVREFTDRATELLQ